MKKNLVYKLKPAMWAFIIPVLTSSSLWAQDKSPESGHCMKIIIDTDKAGPPCYRFWDVRVTTNQMDFLKRPASLVRSENPFATTVNCVRLLGGRPDSLNLWYKGVDEKGNIKTDFTDLVRIIRTILDGGIKPYIVLDNVPTEMSDGDLNFYGNCKPPKDYNLWRQYIEAFMKVLVREFGPDQVKTWQFRVGTEPDLFPNHWNGSREEYFKHYDITVDAVTKVLPEAIIGPGNILNPTNKFWVKGNAKAEMNDEPTDIVGKANGWGLSIIDHAAVGTNYVTGNKGTKMDFFGFSYYDAVGGKRPILLDKAIEIVRERLARYPELKNLPVSAQEFGILQDDNNKRLWGNEITEWGASWYAAISDIAYRYNLSKAYEWSTTTNGIMHPRTLVIQLLERMAGGKRIDVSKDGKAEGNVGAIASLKDGKIYVLLYNHLLNRMPAVTNNISLSVNGSQLVGKKKWLMNEWSVDRDHGVWAYEMYADLEKAGFKPEPSTPIYDGSPGKTFRSGWREIFEQNRSKYQRISESIMTKKEAPVKSDNGAIRLEYDMPGHSVRLLEFIPDK
jgi:xylan 1,4-beta-xylosidase